MSIKPSIYAIMIPERTGVNMSKNPKAAPETPNASIHPHRLEPSDFDEMAPPMRTIPEVSTHMANTNGSDTTNASVPRPNNVHIANTTVRIPLVSSQPERPPCSSPQ